MAQQATFPIHAVTDDSKIKLGVEACIPCLTKPSSDECPLPINDASPEHKRRLQIRQMILNRLRKQNSHLDDSQMKKIAACIECKLLKLGIASQADSDAALNKILLNLMGSLLKKRKSVAATVAANKQQQSNTMQERMNILQKKVEPAIYQKICQAMDLIHKMRLTRTCAAGVCKRSPSLAANEKAPEAVQKLFFQTQLVLAVERAPVEQFGRFPWNALLDQANENIRAYQEWKGSQE